MYIATYTYTILHSEKQDLVFLFTLDQSGVKKLATIDKVHRRICDCCCPFPGACLRTCTEYGVMGDRSLSSHVLTLNAVIFQMSICQNEIYLGCPIELLAELGSIKMRREHPMPMRHRPYFNYSYIAEPDTHLSRNKWQ